MNQPVRRRPHAVLDLPSRDWKAVKIERLLQLANRLRPFCLLGSVRIGLESLTISTRVRPALRGCGGCVRCRIYRTEPAQP